MTLNWRKSTKCSSGGCVEVAFRKASASGSNGCVEVGAAGDEVLVRDSKLGDDSPVITFSVDDWEAFKTAAKAWEGDRCVWIGSVGLDVAKLDNTLVCVSDGDMRHLHYTQEEWDAFMKGVEAGEFDAEALAAPVGEQESTER